MTTYKSYAECKIANPDSEIVTTGKNWKWAKNAIGTFSACNAGIKKCDSQDGWVVCNPANHCSTLKEFLDAGLKLVEGDEFIGIGGNIVSVENADASNMRDDEDDEFRYILSSAALNGGCKIPAKAEQWTVYNNTLPLCELTDEQVGKLVKNSGCVEHMNPNSGEWGATITPMWNRAGIYRIKPKSERELFIEAAVSTFDGRTGLSEQAMSLAAQTMFDSGKFKRVIKDGE